MATLVAVPVSSEVAVLSTLAEPAAIPGVEQLVAEHLPMVRVVARKLHRTLPQQVELDDLVSAGMLGLLDAAMKFQAGRDTQFRTYAQFRVRGAMLDSLRQEDWGSRDQRRKAREIETAMGTLAQRLGRAPEECELAAEMGVALGDLRQTLGDLRGLELGSLQAVRDEEGEEPQVDYIPDSNEPGALFRCMEAELRQHLVAAIEALPERERLVVTLYYYEELTMREIGEVLGVVESRVSQLRSAAVLKLRAALKSVR